MLLAVVRVHEHWWPPVKAVRVGVGLKKESYLIQGQLGHAETNIHCISFPQNSGHTTQDFLI